MYILFCNVILLFLSEMLKSKLIQVLKGFSKKEMEGLYDFLKDSNFNKHDKVIELFVYIIQNIGINPQLSKEKVYSNLFQLEKYNDSKLRHLMSYLLRRVEEFGFLQSKNINGYEVISRQLSFYEDRSFAKGFNEVAGMFTTKSKHAKVHTSEEKLSRYHIYTQLYNDAVKRNRTEIELLSALNQSLDQFFVLSKLKIACGVLNQQTIFNQTINSEFFNETIEYTRIHYLEDPMISLYYHLYRLVKSNEISMYSIAKNSFLESIEIEDKLEIKDALLLLINFCIRQINQGNKIFETEVFELYKIGMLHSILLEKKKLSPFTYGNAISIGIKQGAIEWVANFIETYRFYLDTDISEDFYALNKSKLLFAQHKYNEALEFINRSTIQDLLSQLQLRIIQIKIFVELDEYALATSFIDNFKQMLKRKNILSYHKENFKKIAKYILKVIQLAPYSKIEKEKLKQEILQQKVLSEKGWLLEKLQ